MLKDPSLINTEPSTKQRHRSEGPEQSITLKISTYDSEMLSAFCLLDETPLADQLRKAVSVYVENRKTDKTLSAKIEEANAERERTLSALAQTGT